MTPRALSALLVALLVALLLALLPGCGEEGVGGGDARLWVTRDRGAVTIVDAEVPAGQTLLRALRSRAEVETRYGGRFVQAIAGVEGSAARRRDWFWFVNGLLGDRSAAEYRLRDGDVAWWDYRDWSEDAETLEVAVGAFPEPFLHGYDGRTRPVAVRYTSPRLRTDAERVAERIGATSVALAGTPVAGGAHLFELVTGPERLVAALRTPGTGPDGPVQFTFAGDVGRLLDGAYEKELSVP